jgi:uncharacterized protein (DUF1778 family)
MAIEPTSRLEARLPTSVEDQRRFADELINPQAPNSALTRAKALQSEHVEVR